MNAEERRAWAERAKDDSDLAAYLLLYDVLEEKPSDALPPDFAETVTRRAFARQGGARRAWYERAWAEDAALLLLLVAATAGAFLLAPGGFGLESFSFSLDSFDALRQLWHEARTDLIIGSGLVLLVLVLFDRFGSYWMRRKSTSPA